MRAPRARALPHTRPTGIGTIRFTTELLPLLAYHAGLVVAVTGDPADYREAGDSLRITVSPMKWPETPAGSTLA